MTLCGCGCGERTTIATKTCRNRNVVKGQPLRFLPGHHLRLPRPNRRRQNYRVEDRGYRTPCWTWLQYVDADGYGAAWDGKHMNKAHRVLFEQRRGAVPPGQELDHLCRNRDCVNPDHLEPVTHAENMRRGTQRFSDGIVFAVRLALVTTSLRPAAIADMLGVSASYVRLVQHDRR